MGIWKEQQILQYVHKYKIQLRPEASLGLWLMFLLPSALVVSVGTQPIISTSTYKLSSIFSVGLICSSLLFLYKSSTNKHTLIHDFLSVFATVAVAVLFKVCLHRGILFSLWSASVSIILYQKLYLTVLKKLPNCFTLGEAAVCTQGFILLVYHTTVNVFNCFYKTTSSTVQMSTLTIQLGLLGITTIIILTYQFSLVSAPKFYLLTISVFLVVTLFPLQILLKTNALMWIFNLIWEDIQRNKVVLYWTSCCVLAVIVVNWRIKAAQKASTAIRKIFHILTTVVYIFGLIYNCSFLYLASGVILGIFIMLEVLRVLNLPPLGHHLQSGLVIFADNKDNGIIAFTPMYLLAGCSLPLWIHPAPCDVTNSATFSLLPLLSGVLTTGIGDTAASIVGSKFGTWHWRDSKKSVQGTLACIVSQLIVIYALVYFDFLKFFNNMQQAKVVMGVVLTSLIEAKTDQIDNLVLPFVMYVILMLV